MIELKKEYKVIIWGLGSVGRSALQIINEKKSLKLVAAYDVDPKKVGRDAGEVCGFSPAGVIVSNDREQVLNTDADICLYYAASMWDEGKLPVSLPADVADQLFHAAGVVRQDGDAVVEHMVDRHDGDLGFDQLDDHGIVEVHRGAHHAVGI